MDDAEVAYYEGVGEESPPMLPPPNSTSVNGSILHMIKAKDAEIAELRTKLAKRESKRTKEASTLITLRDFHANRALSVVIQKAIAYVDSGGRPTDNAIKTACQEAYRWGDAMVEASKKVKP